MGMDVERFHARRRSGIGGSDAAAVLGVSPWKSRLGVWEEKVGLRPPEAPSERMVWGTRLENAVAQGYAEDYAVQVRRVGFRRHPQFPFVIGHPDRSAGDRGLEIKTAGSLSEEWGEELTDKVPPHYWAQVQHYSMLMGWAEVDLAVLVRGNELHLFRVPANEEFQVGLREEERILWVEHVLTGIPPEPDGSEDAQAVLRRRYREALVPDRIVATPEIDQIGRALAEVKRQRKELKRQETELESRLMAYIGIHAGVQGDGWSASWGNRKGSLHWKSIAEVYRRFIEWTAANLLKSGPLRITDGIRLEGKGVEIETMADLGKFLETVEGLYRGESSRTFRLTVKGMEDDTDGE